MNREYGAPEMMAVAMSRLVRDGELVFVGVNSPLPMVAVTLARQLHAPDCTIVTIAGGINPSTPRLSAATSSSRLAVGSASVFNNEDLYGLNARGAIDTTFLGLAMVDEKAHVNSSFIGDPKRPKVRFPGGGGGGAIMPLAKRAILWRAAHSPRIFVKDCGFVTATGNIHRIVTPLCVFRKEDGRLVLDSVHPYVDRRVLAEETGFEIPNLESAPVTPAPTPVELEGLRRVDPDRVRDVEFGAAQAAKQSQNH